MRKDYRIGIHWQCSGCGLRVRDINQAEVFFFRRLPPVSFIKDKPYCPNCALAHSLRYWWGQYGSLSVEVPDSWLDAAVSILGHLKEIER